MPLRCRLSYWILATLLLYFAAGCTTSQEEESRCESCHQGLELASPTHGACTTCHGGDPGTDNKDAAHRGMFGKKNPAAPEVWDKGCGGCHEGQLKRVRSNLMYTNTGIIKNAQLTWEGVDGQLYATRQEEVFDAKGEPQTLRSVRELDNLSGELYRKFCSLCHVGQESNQVWSGSHGSGCAACHFPYNDNATYQGGDETVHGKWPYSASHEMASLPDNKVCARCHNRSGRIALSYQGQNDGNNSLVPTRDAIPGPELIGGVRNVTSIAPDIHHAKGMDCIDCHTSRDVMGDGYAYENMYLQTETACEDCHGSAHEHPRLEAISRENDSALVESRNYKLPMTYGANMVLTTKGRKYANVFEQEGKIWLQGKRSGKLHESKVITDTPEHTIVGHERLECYSCHSRTVVQCYGCHTEYDLTRNARDFVKGYDTPGAFTETEDFRMLYPFPLALNQRGKISPVTPGCQTFVTVIERDGRKSKDEYVARFGDRQQLRFAPFYSHNTGTRAVGCAECHGNPSFLGFGQHVIEGATIEGTLLCEKSDSKPLDGYLTMEDGKVKAFSAITRENSRPLNGAEVKKVLAVNLCLVCHDNPKDPIYQKELDYGALDRCLERSVPARP
ncbi:cytochrome c family protein [Desulfuromonas sp. KJ2020]|uniref:selenite/tellurite reduction operon c-type cytochrome ExtM n=1 Tax=Desulfuromonas sp. KJ2020 TaxID=2919173 RepID=UPI0020A7DCC0|nr:cytochrome c family protein [Desulfuromonas sp. KJ2020]